MRMLVEAVAAAIVLTGFVWILTTITRGPRRNAWGTAAVIFAFIVVRGIVKWRTTPPNARSELVK
jgi:hypothetical protein